MSKSAKPPRGTTGGSVMHGWDRHTTDGDARLWIGHSDAIYWFRKEGRNSVVLTHVEHLDGDDVCGEHYSYVELPKKVKKRLKQENVRMVSDTLAGCM